MKIGRGLVVASAVWFAWACISIANASAAPVEWSSRSSKTPEHSVTCSGTKVCEIMLSLPDSPSGSIEVVAEGETIGTVSAGGSMSFLLSPTRSWLYGVKSGEITEIQESHATVELGGGGSEGKEGKEGKEGPAGPEGKEGPEGKAGSSAGTKVEGFGEGAETTFSEIVERMEILAWCIVGTLIAGVLYLAVRDMLRVRAS